MATKQAKPKPVNCTGCEHLDKSGPRTHTINTITDFWCRHPERMDQPTDRDDRRWLAWIGFTAVSDTDECPLHESEAING